MTTKKYIIIGVVVLALIIGLVFFFKSKGQTKSAMADPSASGGGSDSPTDCIITDDERKDGYIKLMDGTVTTDKKIKLPSKADFDLKVGVTIGRIKSDATWLAAVNLDRTTVMESLAAGKSEDFAVCAQARWVVAQRFFY